MEASDVHVWVIETVCKTQLSQLRDLQERYDAPAQNTYYYKSISRIVIKKN